MFCKNCGAQIKDKERFCPKCGTPVKDTAESGLSGNQESAIPSMASLYIPKEEKPVDSAGNTAEKVEKTVAKAVSSISDGTRKALDIGGETIQKLNESMLTENRKGKMKLILAAAATVVLVLVLGIINGARINNFFHVTFSSPEKYYHFVEKKSVSELASNAGVWYDSYFLDMLNFYDKGVEGELEVKIGEDGQEFLSLSGIAGVDLSWLKSVTLSADAAVKDDVFSCGTALRVNKSDILSGNLVMDMGDGNVYLQIPELNKSFLGVRPDLGYEFKEFQDFQASSKKLMEAFPSQAEAEKLVKRYMNIALDYVKDVEKNKKVLNVEGVSQKCTALEVKIDTKSMMDIMEAILKEMKTDKDIKAIITNLEAAGDMEINEEFQQGIEDTLEILDEGREYADWGREIEMTVYVDGKGDIKGRSIDWGVGEFSSMMAEKGKAFGYELSFGADGMSVTLSGDGKKSGDALSGDFKLKYNGASMVDITARKINKGDLMKGRLNGGFDLEVSSSIATIIGHVPGLSVIEDIKLTVDSDSSGRSQKCEVGLIYGGQDIGSFVLTSKTGKGTKASLPAAKNTVEADSEDALMEWVEEIDINSLVSALEKADMPSKYTKEVKDLIDTLEWYAQYAF